MKKTITVLFIAIGMIMGGMFSSQKADAAGYAYSCVVPYNIKWVRLFCDMSDNSFDSYHTPYFLS